MTVGMCMDYVDDYIELSKPKEERVIEATQEHFDAF